MTQPYVGEIRIFAGNFAPQNWEFCEGQLLPISENETLFNLIGTFYGGDGQSTFAMPDLRGRVPISFGQGAGLTSHTLAEIGGVERVTLTVNQMPAHSHTPRANAVGDATNPSGHTFAGSPDLAQYAVTGELAQMHASAAGSTGANQSHENLMPYRCVHFIICKAGVFPNSGSDSAASTHPYLSEIRMFAREFAPGGWHSCDGTKLAIAQNQALFSLLGTTYGGDGRVDFGLPDLRGRVPIDQGGGDTLGQRGGEEVHALTLAELPAHSHAPARANAADASAPGGKLWADAGKSVYADGGSVSLWAQGVSSVGGGQAHLNVPPYLAINFCIRTVYIDNETTPFPDQS